jgi:hypothetical protein
MINIRLKIMQLKVAPYDYGLSTANRFVSIDDLARDRLSEVAAFPG